MRVNIFNEKGQPVVTIPILNRVLNNWLNFELWKILPTSIGASVFPEFADITNPTNSFEKNGFFAFGISQTIDDTSTTMQYSNSVVQGSSFFSYLFGDNSGRGSSNAIAESMLFETTVEAADDGKEFTGFGYGITITGDQGSDNWLMAYLDLEGIGIIVYEGWLVQVVRDDYYETKWEIMDAGKTAAYMRYIGVEIDEISFCYDREGQEIAYTEQIENLTITRLDTGVIEFTGFEPFLASEGFPLFPSDETYPSDTTYPGDISRQYKSCIFHMAQRTDATSDPYGPFDALLRIEDLAFSFDNGEISIRYIYERG